jgi:ketosteroid isomerase-like protein
MAAETATLRAAAQAYHDAATVMDIDAVAALYAADAAVYAPDTPTIQDPDGVAAFLAGFAAAPGIQVDFDLVEVVVSADADMGYTMGLGEITMDGPDGEPLLESVRDFHVWRKDVDGTWKLVVDIWNSPVPLTDPTG